MELIFQKFKNIRPLSSSVRDNYISLQCGITTAVTPSSAQVWRESCNVNVLSVQEWPRRETSFRLSPKD